MATSQISLYGYFRSSAAYRVRIALGLKGLQYDQEAIHLLRDGGSQHSPAFRTLNPQGLVPLVRHSSDFISQSLAILEFLEEEYPSPPLLPEKAADRAWVRSIAAHIACDVHPLNNLRLLKYLENNLNIGSADRQAWIKHWITLGFEALEEMLDRAAVSGKCCFGDEPTLADCCVVPQVFSARRFNVSMAPYPTLARIDGYLADIEAFRKAHPSEQPDAE